MSDDEGPSGVVNIYRLVGSVIDHTHWEGDATEQVQTNDVVLLMCASCQDRNQIATPLKDVLQLKGSGETWEN